jgi:hypothetical protein
MIDADRHEDISRAVAFSAGGNGGKRSPELPAAQSAKVGQVAEMKVLDKTEQSDQASSRNEKPESCYCSGLPKGSGPCLSCYTRWLASRRSKEVMAEDWDWLADQQESAPRICVRKNRLSGERLPAQAGGARAGTTTISTWLRTTRLSAVSSRRACP